MRVGAIDCGTNTSRLLIADVDSNAGGLVEVVREMRIVRLGQGVDASGRLADDAMARARTATAEFAEMLNHHQVDRSHVMFVATSATRDASNADEFTALVQETLGVQPRVISGDMEAQLSFAGARAGAPGAVEPVLVVDLGGGSTEVVLGGTTVEQAFSMDVGCVRLTERHLHSDPPTPDQIEAASRDVDAALNEAAHVVPFNLAASIVGVAGTVTTLTGVALGLTAYDRDRISGATISVDEHLRVCERVLAMTTSEREATGVMAPGRADVLAAGAVIWRQLLRRVADAGNVDVVITSEHDILDGIAMSIAS